MTTFKIREIAVEEHPSVLIRLQHDGNYAIFNMAYTSPRALNRSGSSFIWEGAGRDKTDTYTLEEAKQVLEKLADWEDNDPQASMR
jgi:hypothetical protein